MILTRVGAPADYPVSVQDVREQLRLDDSESEPFLRGLIARACSYVDGQNAAGRAMLTQTWRLSLQHPASRVHLPLHPVQSLSGVRYFDENNAAQSAQLSDYRLISGDEFAYVELVSGATWPVAFDRPDAIGIEFTAGYGDNPEDVPEDLRHALLLLIGHMYDQREATTPESVFEAPLGFEAMLNMERRGWYG